MLNKLAKIYQNPKTVFTTNDLAMLWGVSDSGRLKALVAYYTKTGGLRRIRRGVYVKEGYEPKEAATSIFTPAYISFETVLREGGVIFQYYESIFLASYLSREIVCDGQKITVRKLKGEILTNSDGLINKGGYWVATTERAFLDRLYLTPDYYFDNLRSINWKECFRLVDIYQSRKLKKTLNNYYQKYAQQK